MTIVGAGGVRVIACVHSKRFKKDYDKLTPDQRDRVDQKLRDLLSEPMPAGLEFEKLKGKRKPDIYTVHVTGNYKISMEIEAGNAWLRRVACHDEIDRCP